MEKEHSRRKTLKRNMFGGGTGLVHYRALNINGRQFHGERRALHKTEQFQTTG